MSEEIFGLNSVNKDNVKTLSSQVLASCLVINRLLNIHRDSAKLCLEELDRRNKNGDDFDYEAYIKTKLKDMPKIESGNNFPSLLNFIKKNNK